MFVVNKNETSRMEGEKLIAAVDLGSNSFHLMVARVVLRDNDFILKKIDTLKEQVKLADGLDGTRS